MTTETTKAWTAGQRVRWQPTGKAKDYDLNQSEFTFEKQTPGTVIEQDGHMVTLRLDKGINAGDDGLRECLASELVKL